MVSDRRCRRRMSGLAGEDSRHCSLPAALRQFQSWRIDFEYHGTFKYRAIGVLVERDSVCDVIEARSRLRQAPSVNPPLLDGVASKVFTRRSEAGARRGIADNEDRRVGRTVRVGAITRQRNPMSTGFS